MNVIGDEAIRFADLSGFALDVQYASGDIYRSSKTRRSAAVMVISQSGETAGAQSFLFLGCEVHYLVACEGALKLKESAYLHPEGCPPAS